MYKFFTTISPVNTVDVYPANWNTVKAGLLQNLKTVMRYYHSHPMAVKSEHFLLDILLHLNTPQSMDPTRYYLNICNKAPDLSRALGMTSPMNYGKVFDGVFFGKGNNEIIIFDDTVVNPEYCEKHWEWLQPIKVLRHPKSDLDLHVPDGSVSSAESGFVVITINIAQLAMMYRSFRLQEERMAAITHDSQRSVQQFVRMYVLPNMLPTIFDYALFNRINNLLINAPFGKVDKPHPFYLTDYSKRLDDINLDLLTNIGKVKRDWVTVLRNLPTVAYSDGEHEMLLPMLAPTRQVVWALSLARFPVINFLLDLTREYGLSRNAQTLNRMNASLNKYLNGKVMESVLDGNALTDALFEINDIVLKAKFLV